MVSNTIKETAGPLPNLPEVTVAPAYDRAAILNALGARSIVLVGMMGAGKSSIGRRLATELGVGFIDADTEIEKAAGMSIPEMFEFKGEEYFRAGEARVIARLLDCGPQVLATGGGAFMNAQTRVLVRDKGISIWLKAGIDVLLRRVKRRNDRPLLKDNDPAETLTRLLEQRDPVYAEADLIIQSRDVPHEIIMAEIIAALAHKLGISSGEVSS